MMNFGFMIIGVIASLVGMFISSRLKSKFDKYSQQPLRNGMSGKDIAETMLRHYGIYDVKVQLAQGYLTDHYNPADKTVNLSEPVFNARSVAAAAVAAHECGHAVQHSVAYTPLTFRSAIVPIVSFSSRIQQYIFMASLLAMSFAPTNSSGIVVFVVSIQTKARFDASNSTGKVTKLNNAVMPKTMSVRSNINLPIEGATYITARLAMKIYC